MNVSKRPRKTQVPIVQKERKQGQAQAGPATPSSAYLSSSFALQTPGYPSRLTAIGRNSTFLWNYSHLNTSTQVWSPKFQAKNAGGTASERLSGQNYLKDRDEFLKWFKSCLPRFSQENRSLSELSKWLVSRAMRASFSRLSTSSRSKSPQMIGSPRSTSSCENLARAQ
jgi:hypothetical protein